MIRIASWMVAVTLAVAGAAPAIAQSVYGCSNLAGRHAIPAVEGADGVFYRVDPDMHNFQAFSDETVAQIAHLSEALAALGTTLVYVPIPTKSLVMPDQLPQTARDLGFDLDLATTNFDDIIERLSESGIQTVNLRTALVGEALPIYQTDYRLTSAGARSAAAAIADVLAQVDGFADLPKGLFDTRSASPVTLPSDMRAILQRHCLVELPEVQTETFVSSRFQGTAPAADTALFGQNGARVVLVGTEYTGGTAGNLAGFLAESSGLDVLEYAVAEGGSFAAISTYLTSRAFQDARPAYLIWANPVNFNLAQYGDQPMRELIAAAGGNCRVTLPISAGLNQSAVTADLRSLDPNQDYTLFVDADGAQATVARFDFAAGSGLIRTKQIVRDRHQAATGRFYMPMTGLFAEGAQTVQIALDVPFGANTRVSACFN